MKLNIVLITAFFITSNIFSQIDKLKLDSLFNVLSLNNKAMASISISKNSHVIYQKTIGYSCIDDSIKSTDETKYRIGSITKMFTSVLVSQLIEKNKISLKTTLNKYYPKIPNSSNITIEELLYHRSGIYDYVQDSLYFKTSSKVMSKKEYLTILESSRPEFSPDSTFMYSNSNYILLGYIIEDILHQSYSDVVNQNIISKLNLKNTFYGGSVNCKNNEALSYEFIGSKWIEQKSSDMSLPGGAGAIVSTSKDLAIFIDALFNNKLINSNSLKQMMVFKDGSGMGIFSFPFYERKAFGHTGGIDSYHSMLTYFVKDSLSISYCTNGEVYPMNDILIGVLSCCFNKKYELPTFTKSKSAPTDLLKYVGVYFNSTLNMSVKIDQLNKSLIAQASGQPSFPLDFFEPDKFKYDKAGVIMEFDTKNSTMLLKQNGASFPFKKIK